MFETSVLSRLPADVAEALGKHYIARGEQLLIRARHAREAQGQRDRLRARRQALARIWRTVEGLKLTGLTFDDAVARCAALFALSAELVREIHGRAEKAHGLHKRSRRNLEIARRVAAGQSHRAIAAAVGLRHAKSVTRIVRRLIEVRALDVPGQAIGRHDGSVYLTRVALGVERDGMKPFEE